MPGNQSLITHSPAYPCLQPVAGDQILRDALIFPLAIRVPTSSPHCFPNIALPGNSPLISLSRVGMAGRHCNLLAAGAPPMPRLTGPHVLGALSVAVAVLDTAVQSVRCTGVQAGSRKEPEPVFLLPGSSRAAHFPTVLLGAEAAGPGQGQPSVRLFSVSPRERCQPSTDSVSG